MVVTSISSSAHSSLSAHASAPEFTKPENFIPLRKSDLVDLLSGQPELTDSERADFRRFAALLHARINHELHATAETLKDAYAPFDPDADTRARPHLSHEDRSKPLDILFDRFTWLLQRANFQRLSRAHIEAAMQTMTDWGVNVDVDFEAFERLEVFARGDCMGRRSRRRLLNWYRLEEVELPVYQRLVVMFRLQPHHQPTRSVDTKSVYIKIFKDIPHMDLEMLLPGAGVRMSLIDRLKIIFPGVSGITITAIKVAQGAVALAALTFYGMLAFLGVVGGTIGYGVRSYIGYLNTKQKYQLNLTQSLYFQNLDNNAGVILRLIDEAEEQESREVLLAYFFLLKHAGAESMSEKALDHAVERFIHDTTGCHTDFELHDAVEKLRRFQLLQPTDSSHLTAVALNEAVARLTMPC